MRFHHTGNKMFRNECFISMYIVNVPLQNCIQCECTEKSWYQNKQKLLNKDKMLCLDYLEATKLQIMPA